MSARPGLCRHFVQAVVLLPWASTAALAMAAPPVAWERTFGGSGWDSGNCICSTVDGGYIVVGQTGSFSSAPMTNNIYLLKLASDGQAQWARVLGWSERAGSYASGQAVRQLPDGGFVIAGSLYDAVEGMDICLIRTNENGYPLWQQLHGVRHDEIIGFGEHGLGLDLTTDGGYIVTGAGQPIAGGPIQLYLLKTDAAGNRQWLKLFGGAGMSTGHSVRQTADGGYIVAGFTAPALTSPEDAYLVKTDLDGNVQWEKTFGGSRADWARSVQPTPDGGYVFAGATQSTSTTAQDVWLVKTDADGVLQWQKTFGGRADDSGFCVRRTTDGGYIVAGQRDYSGGWSSDLYLVKTDISGELQWEKEMGGTGRNTAYCIQQTPDGGYVLVGSKALGQGISDIYAARLLGLPALQARLWSLYQ